MKKKYDGSITVFLALILVLILSLVLVTCEQARVSALRSYAQLMLDAASESAAADYYRPLFDEYGLFALNMGYGKRKTDPGRFESTLLLYAQECSDEITIARCGLSNTIPFLSEGGEIVRRQMLEAEEDTIVSDVLEGLLEKLGIISSENKMASALSRKIGIEAELYRIDEYTLELMRLVDGVRCDVSALSGECSEYGIESSFIKKFFVLPFNSINLGINNQTVYRDVVARCINPVKKLGEADELAYRMISCGERIDMLRSVRSDYEQAKQEASEEQKSDILSEIERIDLEIGEYEALLNNTKTELTNCLSELGELCSRTQQNIIDAEAVVGSVGAVQAELQPSVLAYEEFVKSLSEDFSEDMIDELSSSIETMKAYVGLGTDVNVTDFAAIKSTLESDRMLLEESDYGQKLTYLGDDESSLRSLIDDLSHLKNCFSEFSYSGLQFDYSGFGDGGIGEAVEKGIEEGIESGLSAVYLEILLDEDYQYSKARMNTDYLPEYAEVPGDSSGGASRDGVSAADIMADVFGEGIPVILSSFLSEAAIEIYEKSLEAMYVHDYFESFAECIEKTGDFLTYGQEYILCGHSEDDVNLASVTSRIMLVRLFFSGLHYFTDSTANALAETASQAADITGLPFLSVVMKYAILLLWSLEQAMIETSAILSGRSVPIITTGDSACVDFSELLVMSPELIRNKAEGFTKEAFGLGYEEYILLFLLITDSDDIVKRTINMAQENIRYEYDDNFLMVNCIAGFSAYMNVEASAKYTQIFKSLQKGLISPAGYKVSVSSRYSYEGVNY